MNFGLGMLCYASGKKPECNFNGLTLMLDREWHPHPQAPTKTLPEALPDMIIESNQIESNKMIINNNQVYLFYFTTLTSLKQSECKESPIIETAANEQLTHLCN